MADTNETTDWTPTDLPTGLKALAYDASNNGFLVSLENLIDEYDKLRGIRLKLSDDGNSYKIQKYVDPNWVDTAIEADL